MPRALHQPFHRGIAFLAVLTLLLLGSAVAGSPQAASAVEAVSGGKVTMQVNSYDQQWTYALSVNGSPVTMPTLQSAGASAAPTQIESGSFPAGTLTEGANTIVFTPGMNGSGIPDRVYLTNIKVALDDGRVFEDAASKDTVINVGYDRVPHEFSYSFTIVVTDDVSQLIPGGTVTMEVNSYDQQWTYAMSVNGSTVTMPTLQAAPASSPPTPIESGSFPAGTLTNGVNTIVFTPGMNGSGVPDRVYLTNIKVVLDDGRVFEDANSKGVVINVGFDRVPHEFSYSFDISVDSAPGELSLSLADGDLVSGTVSVVVDGIAPVSLVIDGTERTLETAISGGKFVADVNSYDGAKTMYSVSVNGAIYPMPEVNAAPGGGGVGDFVTLESEAFPVGALRPGTNTVSFLSGPNSSGVPDRVYLRNVKIVLDDGTVYTDQESAAARIDVGYDRDPYEFAYPYTFTALGTSSRLHYSWDTTTTLDGIRTVTVTDADGSMSAAVIVDNSAPVIEARTPAADTTYSTFDDFLIDVSGTDATDGAVPVTITIDGNVVENGALAAGSLIVGDHELVATATDLAGHTGTATVTFAIGSYVASDPAPASGEMGVSSTDASLSVTVTTPGAPVDVRFARAEVLTAGELGGISGSGGTSKDGEPAPGAGTPFSSGASELLNSIDTAVVEQGSSAAYPFQQFEVTMPEGTTSDSAFEVFWRGDAPIGQRVVLSVWDYLAEEWLTVDEELDGGSFVNLTGEVAAINTVRDGTAIAMVQVRPGYIAPSTDGVTNFAWLTDTQYYSSRDAASYASITQWIADNSESDKIAYTVHTGDIVDIASSDSQWVNANAAMTTLDAAGIPYGVVSGNHDYESGYSHYREYFGEERFADNPWYGGTISDNVQHFDYVSTPEADYLFLYLTWSATPAEWEWVKDVIRTHPDANVILGTHEQFTDTGVLLGQGQRLMSEIIQPFPNVRAILSGHKKTSYVWVQRFDDGRVVLQVQGNYQHVRNEYSDAGGGYLRYIKLDAREQTFTNETFTVFDTANTHAWPETGCESLTEAPDASIEMTDACINAENFVRPVTIAATERSLATDFVRATVRTGAELGLVSQVESGSRASVPAGDLALDAAQHWYVDLIDAAGNSVSSPVWSFTTATGDGSGNPDGSGDVPTGVPASIPDPQLEGNEGEVEVTVSGRQATIKLGEAHAEEWVGVYVHSTPQFLGWHQTSGAGTAMVTLPDTLAAGEHRLVVLDRDGALIGWANIIVSAAGGTDGALATTGSELLLPLSLSAVLLLLVGTAAIRMRRHSVN